MSRRRSTPCRRTNFLRLSGIAGTGCTRGKNGTTGCCTQDSGRRPLKSGDRGLVLCISPCSKPIDRWGTSRGTATAGGASLERVFEQPVPLRAHPPRRRLHDEDTDRHDDGQGAGSPRLLLRPGREERAGAAGVRWLARQRPQGGTQGAVLPGGCPAGDGLGGEGADPDPEYPGGWLRAAGVGGRRDTGARITEGRD